MLTGLLEIIRELRVLVALNGNHAAIRAPVAIATSYTWTLPNALPGSSSALIVAPDGTMSYGSGGGYSDEQAQDAIGAALVNSASINLTYNDAANTISATAVFGTTGGTIAQGDDSRFHTQNTDTGTTQTSFAIDSSGTGVLLRNSSGALRLRNLADSADADLIVGNLTVTGITTTVNSETVTIDDNIIVLNSNIATGTPTEDAGLEIRRGSSTNARVLWDEANDVWRAGLSGAEVPLTRIAVSSFTNAALVAGVLTVTHNLNQQFVMVRLYDNTNRAIGEPDNITATNVNSCAIDLTSFGTIPGTWRAVVFG